MSSSAMPPTVVMHASIERVVQLIVRVQNDGHHVVVELVIKLHKEPSQSTKMLLGRGGHHGGKPFMSGDKGCEVLEGTKSLQILAKGHENGPRIRKDCHPTLSITVGYRPFDPEERGPISKCKDQSKQWSGKSSSASESSLAAAGDSIRSKLSLAVTERHDHVQEPANFQSIVGIWCLKNIADTKSAGNTAVPIKVETTEIGRENCKGCFSELDLQTSPGTGTELAVVYVVAENYCI
ncbi:hypothetical protein DFH11DRAFT_1798627 [Phellopilus nigrolimitatus]|nr:hypothetical protein DFH11DRAFT_1798627 [Phellopilus nigrolimitatus]